MVMNFARESFRRSFVYPAEIFPWKIVCRENPVRLGKQNIYVGIFRQSGNDRIQTIVLTPESNPSPWSPVGYLAQLFVPSDPILCMVVYFQQNKKRRKSKVKIVMLQLCGVRKIRYILYGKLPTCAA
jgi:hypothetical protein